MSLLTIVHVTVSLCGIQLDGLQEVPLCFCLLPLRETNLTWLPLLLQLLFTNAHLKNSTLEHEGQNTFGPVCLPSLNHRPTLTIPVNLGKYTLNTQEFYPHRPMCYSVKLHTVALGWCKSWLITDFYLRKQRFHGATDHMPPACVAPTSVRQHKEPWMETELGRRAVKRGKLLQILTFEAFGFTLAHRDVGQVLWGDHRRCGCLGEIKENTGSVRMTHPWKPGGQESSVTSRLNVTQAAGQRKLGTGCVPTCDQWLESAKTALLHISNVTVRLLFQLHLIFFEQQWRKNRAAFKQSKLSWA